MLLLQVNYHASNEYESVPNYKVLQQGFTAITLTRVSGCHHWQPLQSGLSLAPDRHRVCHTRQLTCACHV